MVGRIPRRHPRLIFTNHDLVFDRLPAVPETAKRWNSAALSAVFLAIGALFANFAFFFNPPLQGVLPWLSLVLAIAGLVTLVVALQRAIVYSQMYRGKVLSIVFGVLTLLFAGVSIFASYHARSLPKSMSAPQVGQQVSDFSLADTTNQIVTLDNLFAPQAGDTSSPAPKAVLLIFYRGYW